MNTNTENFETQARRMWSTRPARLPRSQSPHSWFFGVCEGIAVRYQVSPVLVRLVVGLSVTLGGLGLWFYLAALLVLPRYGVPLSPAEVLLKNESDPRYAPDRTVGVRTLIVAVILLLLGGIGSGGVTLGGVVGGVVATAVVWWLLHQRLPVPPAGMYVPRQDAAPGPAPAYTGVDLGSLSPAEGFTAPRTAPPSWDPLGAAPFAWDLPDPPEEPVTPPPPGRSRRSAWRRLAGALLGVLLALGLAAAAVVAYIGVGLDHSEDSGTTSTRRFTRSTVPVVSLDQDRTVRTLVSDVDVDLADLRFPAGRDSARLTIDSRLSGVDVLVPETTEGESYRLRVDCTEVSASDVDCERLNGIVVRSTDATFGDSRSDGGNTLTVEIRSAMSEIRMRQHPAE